VFALAIGFLPQASFAQLPAARLTAVFPPGGRQATTVEVTLTGSDLEDLTGLYFDHPGLKAEPVTEIKEGKPVPVAGKFKVTIAADVPLGLHDVRAVGRYGISNPRAFVVGDVAESNETEPNNTPAQAGRILADKLKVVTINGQINGGTDVDAFLFGARAGQRVLVDCQAYRIDSRLNPTLTLLGPGGKEVAYNDEFLGRDAMLDVTIPADGDYVVLVTDQVYDGSPEYFYRLTIGTFPYIDYMIPPAGAAGSKTQATLFGRNLPGGKPSGVTAEGRPLDQLAVEIAVPAEPAAQQRLAYNDLIRGAQGALDGFEYRLKTPDASSNAVFVGIANAPVVLASEPNDTPDKAQAVTLPCEIEGQFQNSGDVDWFSFTAKGGEVWWFEIIAQRTGTPCDPFLVIRRAADNNELGSADDDGTNPIGLRYQMTNDDCAFRYAVPADGQYLVALRDQYGDARSSPRHIYRLKIQREQPDFRLLAMHNAPGIPNMAQQPDSLLVRQGGNQHLDVYVVRNHGFNGEITVQAQGLPAGVTCPPVVIAPGQAYAPLVFSATDAAPIATVPITVTASAKIGDQMVTREARAPVLTWAFDPNQQIAAQSRLARTIPLAVREGSPYQITATPAEITVSRGLPAKLKVQTARRGDFKGQIDNLTAVSLPPNAQNAAVAIPADKNDVEIALPLPVTVPVGSYTVALRGNAPVPFTKDPKGQNKQNVNVYDVSTPVRVIVTDPMSFNMAPAPGTIKKGATLELTVTATRQGGYTGPIQFQLLQLPGGTQAPAVTVPAEANQGKLVITAAATAAPGMFTNVLLRGTVTVNGQGVNIDVPYSLKVE
jgi:hypothetical protein